MRRWSIRRGASRLAALGVLVLCLGAAACGSDDTSDSEARTAASSPPIPAGPIVIGQAIAKTGAFAPYDLGPDVGLQVAVDDINARGGIDGHKLKLVFADTQSQPAKGGAAAQDVMAKGARVVVVTCDFDFGSAAAQAAVAAGNLAISTCGASARFNPEVLGRLLFTMATSTTAEGELMGRWAYERKGWRRAFLLEDPSLAYNKDLCEGFEGSFEQQSGASIVGSATFKGTDTKFGPQIAAIKKADPDFVWLCAATPAGPTALKQLRAAGVDTPVLSGAGMDGSYWIEAVPDLSNFYFDTYGSIFGDDPRAEVNEFFAKEERKTGTPPVTSFDMTGYALGEALARAIGTAGSLDGEALADALETLRDEPLLVGPTTFTAESHLNGVRPMAIIEVQDGKFSFLELFPSDR